MGLFGIIALAIAVINLAVSFFLRPRVKAGRSEPFDAPTAQTGDPIPVIYGTQEVSPNCVWFGNLRKRSMKDGQLTLYYANMHQVFSWGPINEIIDILFDDKSTRNHHLTNGGGPVFDGPELDPGTGAATTIVLQGNQNGDEPESDVSMFGGDTRGGGINGPFTVYWGRENQPADPYLETIYGRSHRWPGVFHAVMGNASTRFYQAANNPAPYPLKVLARRTAWWTTALSPLGQTAGEATLGYDANPIEILYDILTNQKYALGRPASLFDTAEFIAAAEALRDEQISATKIGFGISVGLQSPEKARETLEQINQHVDGVFRFNPNTGLIGYKLIRDDYDPDTLEIITESEAEEISVTKGHSKSTINNVVVKFNRIENSTDRRGMLEDSVTVNDPANYAMTGSVRTQEFDFPFITDPEIAVYVAQRVLRAGSYPQVKVSWRMNRKGHNILRGEVRRIQFPSIGIATMIVRIVDVNYGNFTDNRITITAVMDQFGMDYVGFVPPNQSTPEPDLTNAGWGMGWGLSWGGSAE